MRYAYCSTCKLDIPDDDDEHVVTVRDDIVTLDACHVGTDSPEGCECDGPICEHTSDADVVAMFKNNDTMTCPECGLLTTVRVEWKYGEDGDGNRSYVEFAHYVGGCIRCGYPIDEPAS